MAIKPEVLTALLQKDLAEAGCCESNTLFPGISVRDTFAVSIRNSLTKKLVSNVAKDADDKALNKFLVVNEGCKNWTLRIDNSKTETLVGLLRQVLYEFWYKPSATCKGGAPLFDHPYDILEKGRVGPGSNIGASGGSFYAKLFSSRLTCSDPSLYFWYKRYIRSFPEFSNAEIIRIQNYGEASITSSSRLSFVPKNDEISRVICIEPTLNTFYQLGIAHILEDRLNERFGISLSSQPFKNRDLARLGSITDGLSTIDLSSASDSMSLEMLRYFLPADFYNQLIKYRCKSIDIKGRGTVELGMVSTMGNGFTFPLQTILFSCIVIAAARFRSNPIDGKGSDRLWGVFGDDIVCPREITADVICLLNTLGFTVNDEKTFVEGPFRESCGADFFNGVDIRGIYIKKVDTPQALNVAVNQLIRFSTKSGIQLRHTIKLLLSEIKVKLFVPPYEDLSSGIHVPYEFVREHFPRNRDTQSVLYELWIPRTKYLRIKDQGFILCPRGYKRLIYNPSGLLLSFLQGEVNGCSIGVRTDTIRYVRKRRSSSFWMGRGVSERDHFDYALDWQRWESVVAEYIER